MRRRTMPPRGQYARQSLIAAAMATMLLACREAGGPTDVAALTAAAAPPAQIISDAARDVNGIKGFYFLPPMLPNVNFPGQFDGTLSPVVTICEWSGAACAAEIARYTTASGSGGERVNVDVNGNHYHVNWHTKDFNLDAAKTYRIRVEVAGFTIGFADVDVVTSGSQLHNVNTNEYIALLDDRTLPIKFRAERGIVGKMVIEPNGVAVEVGEEKRFRIFIYDLNERGIPGAAANWSLAFGGSGGSGAGGSASITADGVFTGVAAGSGSVIATSGGRSVSVPFTVWPPVTSVEFGAPISTTAVASSATMVATPYDAAHHAIVRPVTYASSSASVATIDAVTGVLTGVTPGTTTITATTGTATTTTQVLIYTLPGGGQLTIGPSGNGGVGGSAVITPNQTLDLVATFNVINLPISNLSGYVLWASTSSSVAVVGSGGHVTVSGLGSTTITATVGALTGTFALTIVAPAASVAFPFSLTAVGVGATTTLLANAFDANHATVGRPVTYSSSNPAVATIDATTGVLTGVGAGVTTITATADGVTGTMQAVGFSGSGAGALTIAASGGGSTAMTPGQFLELTAAFSTINVPISNITGSYTWATTSSSVAVVGSDGRVRAVGAGTATITFCINTMCGAITLTVGGGAPIELASLAGWTMSRANDVNVKGWAAGLAVVGGVQVAVRWDDSGPAILAFAGARSCEARGINIHGDVVGSCMVGDMSHGVLWPFVGGQPIDIPGPATMPCFTGPWPVTAEAINDAGIVAGKSESSFYNGNRCLWPAATSYTWDKNSGIMTVIDWASAYSSPNGSATAINGRGEITGTSTVVYQYSSGSSFFYGDVPHAFIHTDGFNVEDLGSNFILANVAGESSGYGINDAGDVVGAAQFFNGAITQVHPVIWRRGSRLSQMGVTLGAARDINNLRWVVGSYTGADGIGHAFLVKDGGAPSNLEPLVAGRASYAGAISQRNAIDNAVYAAGSAQTAANQERAVRWTIAP